LNLNFTFEVSLMAIELETAVPVVAVPLLNVQFES
jgi:hypothetical protein